MPPGGRALWSRSPLLPLADGALTPFSYSIIAELAGRAWYRYYDRLGFNPMPRARVVRQHQGRAYFNLTLSAQREAETAGVEPVIIMVNGSPFPACKVEKGGLFSWLRAGMNERKLGRMLRTLAGESDEMAARAQAWWLRVRELRWSQAEILQIMEEIEPLGSESFTAFLAARQAIEHAANCFLRALPPNEVDTAPALLAAACAARDDALTRSLSALAQPNTAALAWIQAGQLDNWPQALPDQAFAAGLTAFVERFGHFSENLGELSAPRWEEDATPLLRWASRRDVVQPPTNSAAGRLAALPRQAQESLQQIQAVLPLQSRSLAALAYLLAGTRRWALAAAREAMGDKRLLECDSVFFYELEEMKQMMTGEWNISDLSEIQATAARRKAQHSQWMTTAAPAILIGDSPAESLDPIEMSAALTPLTKMNGTIHDGDATANK